MCHSDFRVWVRGRLRPTEIWTLLDRRHDPNKELDTAEFLAAANSMLARVPKAKGNEVLTMVEIFYVELTSLVAALTTHLANLTAPKPCPPDLVDQQKLARSQIERFERHMNYSMLQDCRDCVSDSLRREIRAYIDSACKEERRDSTAQLTSPFYSASRPSKRRRIESLSNAPSAPALQAAASEALRDENRRLKALLAAHGISFDPLNNSNNKKRSSNGESNSMQQLPQHHHHPVSLPLHQPQYQLDYPGPVAGEQATPSHQLASPSTEPEISTASRAALRQLEAFFTAPQDYDVGDALPHANDVVAPEHTRFLQSPETDAQLGSFTQHQLGGLGGPWDSWQYEYVFEQEDVQTGQPSFATVPFTYVPAYGACDPTPNGVFDFAHEELEPTFINMCPVNCVNCSGKFKGKGETGPAGPWSHMSSR
jgi:hypothetical protein